MLFGVYILATDPEHYFVQENCTQITGCLFFYEGVVELFDDYEINYEVIGYTTVPSLGGLTEEELIGLLPMSRDEVIRLEREKSEIKEK